VPGKDGIVRQGDGGFEARGKFSDYALACQKNTSNDAMNMFVNLSKNLKLIGLLSLCAPIFSFAYTTLAIADTAIETETAQIGKNGEIGISQSYEYAHSKDGSSGGTLTQFEYGLSDRAEILIEPFFYTWDQPKGEPKVEGLGDLEITPSYMFFRETTWAPAILAAVKFKVPTGSKKAGSSGKFDYMPYLIFGKHISGWTLNANLGLNITTPESGGTYGKTGTWSLEAEREIAPKTTIFLEGFSTEEGVKTASTALEYQWTDHFNSFATVSYTEKREGILRLGINLGY